VVEILKNAAENDPFIDQVQKWADNPNMSLREFVEKVKSEAPAYLTSLTGRLQVLDGRFKENVDDIVSNAASRGSIVLGNNSALRALNFSALPGTQVDLFMAGHENFSMEGWLQAWARVDRGSGRGARRTVVLDSALLDKHVEEAFAVDQRLRVDGRSQGLFGDELSQQIRHEDKMAGRVRS